MSWEEGVSIATRERCGVCHRVSPIGFSVPNELWRIAVPDYFRESILCLGCFTSFADERMLAWDKDIEFFPVSPRSHLNITGTGREIDEGIDALKHCQIVHVPECQGECGELEGPAGGALGGETTEPTLSTGTYLGLQAFVRKLAAIPCGWGCQPCDEQLCVNCEARRCVNG